MSYCSGKIERFFNGMPVRRARSSMARNTGPHLIISRRGRGDKGYTLTATRGELLREGAFPTASASQDQDEPWGSRGRGNRRFRGRERLFLVAAHAKMFCRMSKSVLLMGFASPVSYAAFANAIRRRLLAMTPRPSHRSIPSCP